jgi:UDP-GlcNAc:undecaprenyl-phosphate GlcNAc-1-phosphate transferase
MWYLVYLYIFCLSLLLSLLLVRFFSKLAVTWGFFDIPSERKIHDRPVPLLGGAAILSSVVVTLLINVVLVLLASRSHELTSLIPESLAVYIRGVLSVLPRLGVIMLGGVIIFLIGLWDDRSDISARVKLLGQILVALVLVFLNIRITFFIPSFIFSLVITVIWMVVIINAFNLLDNMDGLCAGVAVIASVVFWSISARQGHYFIAVLLAVFIGSLFGFLRYNFYPAKIFMGDAGSMFVGYFIAVLTIMQTFYHPGQAESIAVLMPLVILAVPLYDTLSVVVIRISNGESIFKADKRHFSHRMLNLGMSGRGAVCFVYLVTLCTGLSAMLLPLVGWRGGSIILVQTVLIISVVAVLEYFGGKRKNHNV